MTHRLSVALDSGLVVLPETGRIAVFGARADEMLAALPTERVHAIQWNFPEYRSLQQAGYDVATSPVGDYAMALLLVPRERDAARALVAQARQVTDGPIVVDGQKTDGVETLLRDLRKRAEVSDPLSKAHGKLFVVTGGRFDDWAAKPRDVAGFTTLPGVFSADRIDRGSAALIAALAGDLKGRVADLGAGWGALSRAALGSDRIEELHLVEADARALDCARLNVTDPRARFHWADATDFDADAAFDAIITNPPFHAGRKGDPDLGRAFIRAATRLLTRNGVLWLVANRHLPYEQTLGEAFAEVAELGDHPGFKIFRAARPRGRKRS